MPEPQLIEHIREAIEWAAIGIEILGAVVIFVGVMRVALKRGTVRFLLKQGQPGDYESYKHEMGRSLLLGLEFLVAADVIRTVALEPTLGNVAVLGLLVVVRNRSGRWARAHAARLGWPNSALRAAVRG